ncbi:hypothetical protein N9891_01840 [bacterium]|nr:hypothetical protein [bacterium]
MSFPETSWTVLAEATLNGGEPEKAALGALCERYWQPVAAMIRSRGGPKDRVEDLTQDFFLVLMENGFFRRADPAKGKFRTFLLNALRNFLSNDVRRELSVKRGGRMERVPLRDDAVSVEMDQLQFDIAWAETLFQTAVDVTGEGVKKRRGEDGWLALREFLIGGGEMISFEQLGRILEVTAGAAKTEVSRMRGRFREHLKQEVAKTVSSPHEVEEELMFLREALMQKMKSGIL